MLEAEVRRLLAARICAVSSLFSAECFNTQLECFTLAVLALRGFAARHSLPYWILLQMCADACSRALPGENRVGNEP